LSDLYKQSLCTFSGVDLS